MNTATLTGRLTKDIELRTTANGTEYAQFSVAVRRPFKTAGGEAQTDFINCKAWRQKAKFLSDYAHKGDTIGVTGSIQQERYTSRDGIDREWVGINANEVEIISKKQAAGSPARAAQSAVLDDLPMGEPNPYEDSELPF